MAHGVTERKAEPQPPETEPRRSLGAANPPAPPQTEGLAAVGSSARLGVTATSRSRFRALTMTPDNHNRDSTKTGESERGRFWNQGC